MKLNRNKIITLLLSLLAISDIFVLYQIDFFYVSDIISLLALFTVPGLLTLLILKIRNISFWEVVLYTVGISIATVMILGFSINMILPMFGVKNPLSLYPFLLCFNILVLITSIVGHIRSKKLNIVVNMPQLKPADLLYIPPIAFPVLSILGAISLNNGGSNIFAMTTLGAIAIYVGILTIMRNKVNGFIYPYSLFFISMSLLFSTSLRGWFITGHDVQVEYYVFQLTKNQFLWDMSLFKDAYNACLSITILPTIISSFIHFNDIFIYKVLYQIVFSLAAVASFKLFRKFVSNFLAFLSVFHLMLFPTFANDMPMLNRQELAFLFFALMLLVLFNKKTKTNIRVILFAIFSMGMIVSHYSTTFITLGVFTVAYVALFMYKNKDIRFIKHKKRLNENLLQFSSNAVKYYLNFPMIIVLVVMSSLWIYYTDIGNNISTLANKTYKSITKALTQEEKSDATLYSIFSVNKLDKSKQIANYVSETQKEALKYSKDNVLYSAKDTGKYKITSAEEEVLPITPLGSILEKNNIKPYSLTTNLRQSYAKIIQLLLFIGTIVFIVKRRKNRKVEIDYIILSSVGVFVLVMQIVLPFASVDYGVLRTFQQMLFIFAPSITVGCLSVVGLMSKKYKETLTAGIFIAYFLILCGAFQLMGGSNPLLRLNNSGIYYDTYYTHKSEVDSLNWLAQNRNEKLPIQTNMFSGLKLLATNGIHSSVGLLPSIIYKSGYVYLDYYNISSGNDVVFYKGNLLMYKYPTKFLESNKNTIYNNGETKIFK